MSLWAFRFLLWYICIALVQPQCRFTFLWPLHIADIAFLGAAGLHGLSCAQEGRPIVRLGPGTILALILMFFAMLSQYFGPYQISTAWNPYADAIFKNALLLIMVEAMTISVERVWAVQMTSLFCTLWWLKSGVRLSTAGATYAGDRIMGAVVSLIDNPNGFAYMLCVFLPLYLYAYQQAPKRWQRWAFLACALLAIWIIFETGSRSGLLALIAIGAFLVPYYGKNHFRAMAIAAVTIFLIFPLTGKQNIERFKTIPQSIMAFFSEEEPVLEKPLTADEQSAQDRHDKNVQVWEIIKENPIMGLGLNPDMMPFADRFPHAPGQVHCEILMAGRQMGLIGMGIYIGFIAIIFIGGWRVKLLAAHWPAVRDLGWTFQVQAIAFIVGGYFSPGPWNPVMMILAASTSALVGLLREEHFQKMGPFTGI